MQIPFNGPYIDHVEPDINTNKNIVKILKLPKQYWNNKDAYFLVYNKDIIGQCSSLEQAKRQRAHYITDELIKNYGDYYFEDALDFPSWLVRAIKDKKELKRAKNEWLVNEESIA